MAKNDHQFLYLALDLVNDTGNDAGVNDYFWLSFDLNGDGAITPRRDVNYGIWPTTPIRLARQYYLGPGTWTGILTETSTSMVRMAFGASPNSSTPHRIWEFRLSLAELEVDLSTAVLPAVLRFGLRARSSTPNFTVDFPSNFFNSFAALHELYLAHGPAFTTGAIFGGVGFIPSSAIGADGYATTAAGYMLAVRDSAFGGVLNIIGNRTTLANAYAAGARKYLVEHAFGSPAGPYAPLRQTWSNYRWTGSTYVLESFGPDAANFYPLPDPATDFSIDDLLLRWDTRAVAFLNGLHHLRVRFFRPDNTEVPVAVPPSVRRDLSLMIDNSEPLVKINQILHNGRVVHPCDIVTLGASDTLTANLAVQDAQGNLHSYSFGATYGHGASTPVLASAAYAPAPSRRWEGSAAIAVPNFAASIPMSCAYRFQLAANQKVTNGYLPAAGPYTDSVHVTIQKAGSAAMTARAAFHLPLGMAANAEALEAKIAGQ